MSRSADHTALLHLKPAPWQQGRICQQAACRACKLAMLIAHIQSIYQRNGTMQQRQRRSLPTPGDLKSAPLRQGRPQMGSCDHTSAKADLPQAVALAQPPLLLDVAQDVPR